MASFGLGATLAALAVGASATKVKATTFLVVGAAAISLAVLPANLVPYGLLLPLLVDRGRWHQLGEPPRC